MCGIHGFNFKDERLIRKMVATTPHRGPDGEGVFVDGKISLGHNLLAITEQSQKSKQPSYSKDGRYVLVYNGEIYNYRTLRKNLQRQGFRFETDGDTEVLMAGLSKYGINFLRQLNGMFALAFYDKQEQKLFLARDQMGRRPLYYFHKNNQLIFASEYQSIFQHPQVDRRLDLEMLNIFFELGYLPGHKTLIKNIYKVVPGEYLELDLNNQKLNSNILSIPLFSEQKSFSSTDFRDLLGKAVIDHTMGLRPFGLYLSGGLDSSIVLLELIERGMDNITTFTTRFDVAQEKFNQDADLAKKLSNHFGTNHKEYIVTERDFVGVIENTIKTIEEPRYHPSMPAYYLMAEHASKDITVTLTGDGGDELFMGYDRYYRSAYLSAKYKKYPSFLLNTAYSLHEAKAGRSSNYLQLDDLFFRWWYFNKIISKKNKGAFKFDYLPLASLNYVKTINASAVTHPSGDMENDLAALDRLCWLAEDSFIVSDKLGMHFGLESRFPFVDQRMVDYANSINSQEKLNAPGSKGLIRRAYQSKLPDFITNKPKSGWTAPVDAWLGVGNSELRAMMMEVLSNDYYPETAPLFDFDFITNQCLQKNNPANKKLSFPIFYFQIWARLFNIKI